MMYRSHGVCCCLLPLTLLLQQGRATCSTQEHLRAAAPRNSCRRGEPRPSSRRSAGRCMWRRSGAVSYRRRHWARCRAGAGKTNCQQRHDLAGASSRVQQRWPSAIILVLFMRLEQVPDVLPGVNDRELQKEFDVIAGSRTPFHLFSMPRDASPPPPPQLFLTIPRATGSAVCRACAACSRSLSAPLPALL
jgi:hypothetical protein